jgi:hypothetical protein
MLSGKPRRRTQRSSKARPTVRHLAALLQIEVLEYRTLPSTFTVVNLLDAGQGSGSQGDLRYAITTANADPDLSNRIVFTPGLAGTITLTRGPLAIAKDLEIVGPGQDVLTISGGVQSGVLNIGTDPRVQVVTISGLTIADGTGIAVGGVRVGGGIFNDHAQLTVSQCTISGNTVADGGSGGGIENETGTLILDSSTVTGNAVNGGGFGGGIDNHGRLIVEASTIADNAVFGSSNGSGGGGISDGGTAVTIDASVIRDNFVGGQFGNGGGLELGAPTTITNSTISGNNAGGQGGGVFIVGPLQTPTSLNISDCAIMGNIAAAGGGLYNSDAAVTIADTAVSGNMTSSLRTAGGLDNALSSARMTITDSTITDNIGSGIVNGGQMTLSGSTIAGNASQSEGGGLEASYGSVQIVNCTISGNTSAMFGGGVSLFGTASVELTSVTITGNTANGTDQILTGGGGLASFPSISQGGRALLRNTLIAGNGTATIGPDVVGSIISLGFNLIGETDDSMGWVGTDRTGTSSAPLDPLLGPLQDNGGPTLTQALLAGSPAIETGDPTLFGSVDQRGTVRFHSGFDAPVDIGAFDAGVIGDFRLIAPSEVVAGVPFAITVVALDRAGHTASTFADTVHFSSTDFGAALPDDYTFVSTDAGVATFIVMLPTVGNQQLAVNDVALPGIRALASVTVDPPTAPRGLGVGLDLAEADSAGFGFLPAPSGRRHDWGPWL